MLFRSIEDGFLSPFKTHVFETTMDNYTYSGDDEVLMGEPELGKTYTSSEFNRKIEIRDREKKRVQLFLEQMNPDDKTIIFCATIRHAQLIADIINEEVEDSTHHFEQLHLCQLGRLFVHGGLAQVLKMPTDSKAEVGTSGPELGAVV